MPSAAPPSASAAITENAHAGPQPLSAVTASKSPSSRTSVWPTFANRERARSRSAVARSGAPVRTVVAAPMSAGVFGMARTIRRYPCSHALRSSMRIPAQIETTSADSTCSAISRATLRAWCGLTARTITSAASIARMLSWPLRVPWMLVTRASLRKPACSARPMRPNPMIVTFMIADAFVCALQPTWLSRRRTRRRVLPQDHRVSPANLAAGDDGRVDADVRVVMPRSRPQDVEIRREIALRRGRHRAARRPAGDLQQRVPDLNRPADPTIFDEAGDVVAGLDEDVGAEASDVPDTLGIEFFITSEARGGQEMDRGAIEKRPGRHRLVGDVVAVRQLLDIRPILFEGGLLRDRGRDRDGSAEPVGQDRRRVALIARDRLAVGAHDLGFRRRPGYRLRDQSRPVVQEVGPLSRIFRTCDLSGLDVDEREGAITGEPAQGDRRRIGRLALHRFDGIPAQDRDDADSRPGRFELRRLHLQASPQACSTVEPRRSASSERRRTTAIR